MPDTVNRLSSTSLEEVKISELPEAAQANPTDLLETSQVQDADWVSRKLTLDMVSTLIGGSAQVQMAIDAAIADIPPPPPNDWASIPGKPATFPPTLPIAQSGVTNLVTDLAAKAPLASPTFTGDPQAPTPATADNDTSIATTAFTRAAIATYAPTPDLTPYAPKASPVFTGDPKAPTPTLGDNDTSIATTAFVAAALAAGASIVVGITPPPSPVANMLWWHSELGQLFIYYNDGNTTQWVPASPAISTVMSGSVTAYGGFTPSNGVAVVIVFANVITGNSGSWLNTTNGRFTPPAGRYFIQCNGTINAPAGGNGSWTLALRKNGVTITGTGQQGSGSAGFSVPITVGICVDANGTDFFEFTGVANTAGMGNVGSIFTSYKVV